MFCIYNKDGLVQLFNLWRCVWQPSKLVRLGWGKMQGKSVNPIIFIAIQVPRKGFIRREDPFQPKEPFNHRGSIPSHQDFISSRIFSSGSFPPSRMYSTMQDPLNFNPLNSNRIPPSGRILSIKQDSFHQAGFSTSSRILYIKQDSLHQAWFSTSSRIFLWSRILSIEQDPFHQAGSLPSKRVLSIKQDPFYQ